MAQEDRSLLYKNTISLTITINDDGKFQYIKLFEGLSADNEKDFIYGHYIVDISSLLLRDDLPYSEIIHKACWSAVTKNLKNIVENNNIKDL